MRVRKSDNGLDIEVNSVQVNDVRSLYPKDRFGGVINWINSGLLRYADKEKAVDFINTQEPDYLAGTNKTDSLSTAKIIKEFENPKIEGEK